MANSDPTAGFPKSKILLIDDDEDEFQLVSERLKDKESLFELEWADSLQHGIERLKRGKIDVVVLDLFLGDSRGLETFTRLKAEFKNIPIVIMSGLNDEKSAVAAIQQGAQDFLVKDNVDGDRLSRVIMYAIKRHEVQSDPKNVGLIDSFTGLYNRPGFLTLAELHLKTAQRTKKGFFVCFAILNDLARITERFGKEEGDHAIMTTTDILREGFRSADLIARMGPDEFAILPVDQGNYSPKVIFARIKQNQKYYNAQFNSYRLSLSMCAAYFEPTENLTINDLAAKADQIFGDYKSKQNLQEFFVAN